jgi:2,4-dienoyl-CoA reductase-like NADH-dependent reductase (Old Yellow Enzyme family)
MTKRLDDGLDLGRGPAMANRFMLAPLTNMQSHADGTLSDDEYRWLVARAEGGFGLTMTAAAHVQKGGQGFPGQIGIWSDDHLPGLTRLAAGIAAAGSLSSVQLHHAGERTPQGLTGEDVVAPWDDPALPARGLSTAEVQQVVRDFIAAAVRAEKAGFNGVEIHGAHGYLLCEFLDVARNLRTDGYGSDYDGRTRIFREIITGIRAETGPAFQLGLRLSPERFGIDMGDALRFAQEVMTGGQIDYLDMSLWDCFKEPNDGRHKGKPLIAHFAALERGRCPLGVAGKIMSAERAQECLDAGADFVLIGRGAMLHHDFPVQAMADPAWQTVSYPVTRDHYRRERLGESFIEYIASNWPSYIED